MRPHLLEQLDLLLEIPLVVAEPRILLRELLDEVVVPAHLCLVGI
jgi:hypothetical protein